MSEIEPGIDRDIRFRGKTFKNAPVFFRCAAVRIVSEENCRCAGERFCQQEEINRIAIVAPMAAVNIIKNYDVVEKRAVEVPETIEGFVRCANPKCITNMEPVRTSFTVIHGDEISLRCKYCEKITHQNSIEITK